MQLEQLEAQLRHRTHNLEQLRTLNEHCETKKEVLFKRIEDLELQIKKRDTEVYLSLIYMKIFKWNNFSTFI